MEAIKWKALMCFLKRKLMRVVAPKTFVYNLISTKRKLSFNCTSEVDDISKRLSKRQTAFLVCGSCQVKCSHLTFNFHRTLSNIKFSSSIKILQKKKSQGYLKILNMRGWKSFEMFSVEEIKCRPFFFLLNPPPSQPAKRFTLAEMIFQEPSKITVE
ncbi:CLUMA_CG010197, isoform A [Clunio marinus]|uniref:CLUMA_CG010197, isoform A n=1 Tax=Clunio marinus TaxID=568069 RepID=A0A1J1IAT2_9DIPT|nr:CLUMA_CG010197, isoform A [Clunio marinus]